MATNNDPITIYPHGTSNNIPNFNAGWVGSPAPKVDISHPEAFLGINQLLEAFAAMLDPGEGIHLCIEDSPYVIVYGYHENDAPPRLSFFLIEISPSEAKENGTRDFYLQYAKLKA